MVSPPSLFAFFVRLGGLDPTGPHRPRLAERETFGVALPAPALLGARITLALGAAAVPFADCQRPLLPFVPLRSLGPTRLALGAAFAIIGLAVLTGVDHQIEAVLVAAMPDWLTSFATLL